MSSQDTKNFAELADQIEESIENSEINPCSVDHSLVAFCMTRINTLRHSKRATSLSNAPCHLTEIDAAIKAEFPSPGEWDEKMRDVIFERQMATLDTLTDDYTGSEKVLEEAVIFLRAVVVGLDQYKLKISRSHRH